MTTTESSTQAPPPGSGSFGEAVAKRVAIIVTATVIGSVIAGPAGAAVGAKFGAICSGCAS